MRTVLRSALLGCSFFLIAIPCAGGLGDQEFPTSFCPECWRFLDSRDVCQDGACLTCGKGSIAVDSYRLTWTWCPVHEQWDRRPCPEGTYVNEKKVRTALALVVSPGDERLQAGAYCPECRVIPDPMKMARGRCLTCKGPLVAVESLEPVWFWCIHDLYWKAEPCPGNGVRHCCTAYRGALLGIARSFKTSLVDATKSSHSGGSGRVP